MHCDMLKVQNAVAISDYHFLTCRQVTIILLYLQVLRNSTLLFLYRRVRQIVSIIKIVNMIRHYCKDLTMTFTS